MPTTLLAPLHRINGNVNGSLIAFHPDDQPVVCVIDNRPFVGLFTDAPRLARAMADMGVGAYHIKQVEQAEEFLTSLEGQGVALALDPRVENGKTRFTEIVWRDG